MKLRAGEIHEQLGRNWPVILAQLGLDDSFLRLKKAGPCPACGGSDRYTFDNRRGRGDFICRGCGAGDGFALLQRVHGWTFSEARRRVLGAAGLGGEPAAVDRPAPVVAPGDSAPRPSAPTRRVRELLKNACPPCDVQDVIDYLCSRRLWPLPTSCALRAHASAEYWCERQRVGRFSALVAEVRDLAGDLVTAHVTYLSRGRKLEAQTPRKILSPTADRTGCAVRLVPIASNNVLGIAEGLETALAAHRLHELPTWSALNTSLLVRFEPPPGVRTLVVFADRDTPGLEAAARLLERLQGRVRVELRTPPPPAKDWADVLEARAA